MNKVCTKCGVEKELEEFHRTSPFGLHGRKSRCKMCSKASSRGVAFHYRRFDAQLRHYYGIDLEDWARMYNAQGGKCAIDPNHKLGFDRYTHVDHDHKTGEVRGLLCHHCNRALGGVMDNIEVLKKMIDYLEKHARKST